MCISALVWHISNELWFLQLKGSKLQLLFSIIFWFANPMPSRFSHLFLKQMQWLRLNIEYNILQQNLKLPCPKWAMNRRVAAFFWWVKLIAYSVHVFHLTLMFPMPHTTYLWNCSMHNINTTLETFLVLFFVFHEKCIQPKMPPQSTIP